MTIRFRIAPLMLAVTLVFPLSSVTAAAESGPDVSSWQHPNGQAINWGQVRSDGHTFAFVKATEATTYTNPYFAGDWAAIKANGMYRGAYHFARPGSSPGSDQANYFISRVGNTTEGGDLPPALDLEVSDGLSPASLIAWTQSFVSQVVALTGRKPLIYSYPSFWRNQMSNTTAFSSDPLWLADWTGTGRPNYPLPGGWTSYTFWQFTSQASVPGISGNVDMSQYCCDYNSLTNVAFGAARWSDWGPMGTSGIGRPAVATNADGRLEGFVRAPDGTIEHVWQTSPGGAWTSWSTMSGPPTGDPVVARNGDGRLEVFAVASTGQLWHTWQTSPNSGWSSWYPMGGSFVGTPAVTSNRDGRLEATIRGSDGAIWHLWQVAPNTGWTVPSSLGGSMASDPAIALNADGRLELFARAPDQTVRHIFQVSAGSGWGGWSSLGGAITGNPVVGRNGDGRLEVLGLGTDKAIWHSFQTAPNSGWYGFTSFGGTYSSDPTIATNADGRMETFAVDASAQVVHWWQVSPSHSWVPPTPMATVAAGAPVAVGINGDGRLEALARKTDNSISHAWQTVPNGGL